VPSTTGKANSEDNNWIPPEDKILPFPWDRDPACKPTIAGVARDKSDRRDRDFPYLYPCPSTRGQTRIFLS